MPKKKITLIDEIVRYLDSGKAEDIKTLDVRAKSSFADTMIIATGTSTRHVMALAYNLVKDLKQKGIRPANDILLSDGQWVVVDLGALLVHLFTAEARSKYDLEALWA